MTMPRGKGRMKSAGKSVLHDTTAKINPLDKKIDQNDTADHGVESSMSLSGSLSLPMRI